jgi:CRP-like cAMP-binding protein
MTEKDLLYGEKVRVEPGTVLYSAGDSLTKHPIYYVIAGLVRLVVPAGEGVKLPVYLLPDSVFGTVELLLDCPRLSTAYCMENSILYRWDRDGFDVASSVSWELALQTITGLTQLLRIINAEFGDRLGQIEQRSAG